MRPASIPHLQHLGVCPATALSLSSVVALSKVLFLFILRQNFWFAVVKYREELVRLLTCEIWMFYLWFCPWRAFRVTETARAMPLEMGKRKIY